MFLGEKVNSRAGAEKVQKEPEMAGPEITEVFKE